jgi:hypothetical protein
LRVPYSHSVHVSSGTLSSSLPDNDDARARAHTHTHASRTHTHNTHIHNTHAHTHNTPFARTHPNTHPRVSGASESRRQFPLLWPGHEWHCYACNGTQVACFTSTRVQILTREVAQLHLRTRGPEGDQLLSNAFR